MVFSDSDSPVERSRPDWWREVAYAGTKLLYQPALQLIVYIVPVTDILGRLALVATHIKVQIINTAIFCTLR
jgi:hypothetical protein